MPTQASAGFNGILAVSPDGGTTYHDIGELQDMKAKSDTDQLDATSHASAGSKEFVPGNTGWTGTAAALGISGDAGQADVIAALSPKTKLKFRWRPFGTGSGKAQRVGFGYIESWEESAPTSGLVAINLSIKGTGALDMTPQP